MPAPPELSVVVVFHNMTREAPRTLFTLSKSYQRHGALLSYEVIAIDNGSSQPLSPEMVRGFGPEFRHVYLQTESVSPVEAVNHGVSLAAGRDVMVIVDGAHLLTPGVLPLATVALRLADQPFVATVPFHLGPGWQNLTSREGYNQPAEDQLLDRVDWRADGYELFRISHGPSDASLGWFGALYESNCFAMRKESFQRMGGFDPAFVSRGGGLVNLDFFRRAVESPGVEYILLLGEASFHQYHGGVASNAPPSQNPWDEFQAEHQRIKGKAYRRHYRRPLFFGSISPQATAMAKASAAAGLDWWEKRRPE
jgi:hypothetical protein